METLGQKLKNARLAAKRTASEAAKGTRIKIQHIEALERDDYSAVPAPAYAKGFIRIYAEWLNLDPAPLVQEYLDHHAPRERASLMPDEHETQTDRPGPSIPWPKPDWGKWWQRSKAVAHGATAYTKAFLAKGHALYRERRTRIPPRQSPLEEEPLSPSTSTPPPATAKPPSPLRFNRRGLTIGIVAGVVLLVIALLRPRDDTETIDQVIFEPDPPAPATPAPPRPRPTAPAPEGTLPLLDALPPPYIDREDAR